MCIAIVCLARLLTAMATGIRRFLHVNRPAPADSNKELEEAMKKIRMSVFSMCTALLVCGAASAQVTLNSVRVGAKDTVALAKFYQTAFGMQETNRINGA